MFRYIPFLLGAALLLGGLTGCRQTQDAGQTVKAHSRDGVLGLTETNPNLPISPAYHTYADDVRMMEAAIGRNVPGVTARTIRLNGPVAYVRLEVPLGTSVDEMDRIRRQAYQALTAQMPRYRMEVSVAAK